MTNVPWPLHRPGLSAFGLGSVLSRRHRREWAHGPRRIARRVRDTRVTVMAALFARRWPPAVDICAFVEGREHACPLSSQEPLLPSSPAAAAPPPPHRHPATA
eukprot:360819-Chlamydomonas_euryale.AAC.1